MNKEVKDIIDLMIKDQKVRRSIVKESHLMFFSVYFGHYMEFDFADFHREMFSLSEDKRIQFLVALAAREVGKSTILNTSLALWSILGDHQSKFVVLIGQTQAKARQHFLNLKKELEENPILKKDLGPFKEESNEWGSSIELSYYGAKIIFASRGQSLRGLRHKQYRPDLIIADDIEDEESMKTLEGRNKIYDWLVKDVIPAGSRDTRFIVLGTLLHEDSVMMRLKEEIQDKQRNGVYREYPLLDENGIPLWPAKYPDEASVNAHRLLIGNPRAWCQEFLLKIIPDTEQVIHKEWIKTYSDLPSFKDRSFVGIYLGVDLAFSQREAADYCAIVSAAVYIIDKEVYIYILPNPINERMTSPIFVRRCVAIHKYHTKEEAFPKFIVENAGQQKGTIQYLEAEKLNVQGFHPGRTDKRTRLALTALDIESGNILFPKKGCESLIRQLTHFGSEKHDDLSDAFATLILGLAEKPPRRRASMKDIMFIRDDEPRQVVPGQTIPRLTMNTRF